MKLSYIWLIHKMLRRTIAAVSRPLLRQRQHSASTLPSSAAIAAIGGHPFSSFEKALQGREATEEMSRVRRPHVAIFEDPRDAF